MSYPNDIYLMPQWSLSPTPNVLYLVPERSLSGTPTFLIAYPNDASLIQ